MSYTIAFKTKTASGDEEDKFFDFHTKENYKMYKEDFFHNFEKHIKVVYKGLQKISGINYDNTNAVNLPILTGQYIMLMSITTRNENSDSEGEDSEDDGIEIQQVYIDFRTRKNYRIYEGDSFDNLDPFLEAWLEEGYCLESVDGPTAEPVDGPYLPNELDKDTETITVDIV